MTTLLKSPSKTTILIVDDTPDNLRLLTRILEAQNYLVRKALNGRIALQGIYRDLPDLILLDITMPEINGFEVCQQLKASEETAHIPIIFISALDQVQDKVRAFEMGGQDYITKPFQAMEVLMRVRNQLLIQQQQQQLIQQTKRLEQEIQERHKAEAEVQRLSLTDEMTGLYNRRGFFLLAEQHLKMAQRSQLSCCLLFADLDGLKQVNDTLGHDMGDRMIMDTADLLKQTFRDSDILARLGGDEFVALVSGCSPQSHNFCHRLQNRVDQFNQTSDRAFSLSISIGVQHCSAEQEISLASLIAQADHLMYEQKRTKHSVKQSNNPEYHSP